VDFPKSKALIPTSPTMVHYPTVDNHSRHNSKSSQDFWKDKLSDTLEQHLPPLWLTTQPQITTPKTTPNCLGTSQGTTLGDALEQHQIVAKGLQGEIKFHQSTTVGCPKTRLICLKSQSWNPIAQFVNWIKESNLNMPWLRFMWCHGDPPRWFSHKSYFVQIELAQKGMSCTLTL
jgi:hypothetical protein